MPDHPSDIPLPRLSIRRATPQDAEAVRRLTRAAYAKYVEVIGREPLPMTADYHAAVRDHRVDLLFVDHELAGLVEMIMGPDHLMVENIAVRPDSQGRGFGRHLMAHVEGVAVGAGLQELRLYTNQSFASNVALYEKWGFQVDRREEFRGGIKVSMSKRI